LYSIQEEQSLICIFLLVSKPSDFFSLELIVI